MSHAKAGLTCRDVIEFVMAYLDNELGSDERRKFEEHLKVCPSCVNYLDSYKLTVRLGKSVLTNLDDPADGRVPADMLKAIRDARLGRRE